MCQDIASEVEYMFVESHFWIWKVVKKQIRLLGRILLIFTKKLLLVSPVDSSWWWNFESCAIKPVGSLGWTWLEHISWCNCWWSQLFQYFCSSGFDVSVPPMGLHLRCLKLVVNQRSNISIPIFESLVWALKQIKSHKNLSKLTNTLLFRSKCLTFIKVYNMSWSVFFFTNFLQILIFLVRLGKSAEVASNMLDLYKKNWPELCVQIKKPGSWKTSFFSSRNLLEIWWVKSTYYLYWSSNLSSWA